jgi:hypothetical protein
MIKITTPISYKLFFLGNLVGILKRPRGIIVIIIFIGFIIDGFRTNNFLDLLIFTFAILILLPLIRHAILKYQNKSEKIDYEFHSDKLVYRMNQVKTEIPQGNIKIISEFLGIIIVITAGPVLIIASSKEDILRLKSQLKESEHRYCLDF